MAYSLLLQEHAAADVCGAAGLLPLWSLPSGLLGGAQERQERDDGTPLPDGSTHSNLLHLQVSQELRWRCSTI